MVSKELFSRRILESRKKSGEKQPDLAAFLDVRASHISEIETGKKTTSVERLALICQHYQVSADYLLGLTGDPAPHNRADGPGSDG